MDKHMRDNMQLEVLRDITDDVIESDFVPYSCLFDPNTILTKNGELIQIVKITGFTYEVITNEEADLRQVIRRAVAASINTNEYAVWFHTLRRKKRLSPDGNYPDEFSHTLHEAWKNRNEWDRKFTNELYITVVKEGQNADIVNAKGFFDGLIPARDRAIRNRYLDRVSEELDDVVTEMLSHLESFGARRLSIVERDGVYYGEHLEFLEKLINLEERPMPIVRQDLCTYLTSGEITFAYNAMEVRTAEGHRRFGAVLTVKEYKESGLHRIDEFLQIPCEFIVTQSINFIHAELALSEFQSQRYYIGVSGDEHLSDIAELTRILNNNHSSKTDYGEQQTTIFVIGESVREMENSLKQVRKTLSANGIVTIREDLKFEECYWAMLPANFEFTTRLDHIDTMHVGGFVNIHNYPAGNAKGCPWGPPVTLFYTAAGTPYFFNFHIADNGHTSVVGTHGSGKTTLVNFLISESRKYHNRLFYLDSRGFSGRFVEAIGGSYYQLADPTSAHHHLGPLHLADSKANRDFLALWMATLIDPTGASIDEAMLGIFNQTIAHLFSLPDEQRTLSNAARFIEQVNPDVAAHLAPWHGDGEYAFYFDHPDESVAPQNGIIGFNLSELLDHPNLLIPVASYLLHRITMTLDGAPSIIVLDEAWQLLNSPMFAPRIRQWLAYLSSKNALAVMTTEDLERADSSGLSSDIIASVASQIYMPDEDAEETYPDIFGLTEEEATYIEAMNPIYRHFMLKRASETIVAELNLGGMARAIAILSGEGELEDDFSDKPPGYSGDLAMEYDS